MTKDTIFSVKRFNEHPDKFNKREVQDVRAVTFWFMAGTRTSFQLVRFACRCRLERELEPEVDEALIKERLSQSDQAVKVNPEDL
jgi:hypothetical protein